MFTKLPVGAAVLALILGLSSAVALAVDINSAGPAELADALTGVGAAKAAAIVEYRRSHGPFKTADDLSKVDGIGKAIVDQNRNNITVGKSPTAKKTKPKSP
ncbi:MAG: helix-hairpin-helix domain-containing protein [Pseudomonadota bacterium]